MPKQLEIYTLGNLSIRLDETAVSKLASRKAEALLVYLACNPRPHPRETLATMFWDDSPQQRALANLSVLLSSLRKSVGDFLATSRHEISIANVENVWVDSVVLNDALRHLPQHTPLTRNVSATVANAVGLYHGGFLSGFYIQQAGDFSEWALLEQERLQLLAINGMGRLVEFYVKRGQLTEGIGLSLKRVNLDPLREESHRQLIRLFALSGQRNAALEQYQSCEAILQEELGVEPAKETQQLMVQVREGELNAVQQISVREERPFAHTQHNLPTDLTTFIGRDAELAQIAERINQPACRLLTLVGPGGVGKTRLTQEAARQQIGDYLDGVWLVPLASLPSADLLETAVSDALAFTFSGNNSSRTQLLNYLSNKEMLLVFDNYEHLLGETAISFLTDLLNHAPELQVLVSSRERLNIQAEWLYEVGGLPYPTTNSPINLVQFGAMQLFLQRAQQVSPTFNDNERTLAEVAAIVQLLEGMPLGIELAASNVRYHSCAEIAAGIRDGLDFLQSNLRDLPTRHRTLRAAIDHSWETLTNNEQHAFMMLSVFQGSFSQRAARAVLKTNASLLYPLVDKSLVQRGENGRFQLHNLLKQYAADRLANHPDQAASARGRHASYYATFLQQWQTGIKGGSQTDALEAIQSEIENIRAGWQHAQMLDRQTESLVPLLTDALDTLFHFYSMGSWFQEGMSVFEQAMTWLNNPQTNAEQRLRTRLQSRFGWFAFLLGKRVAGHAAVFASLAQAAEQGDQPEQLFCRNYLGAMAYHQQQYDQAQTHLAQALAIARRINDPHGEAIGLNILGNLLFDLNNLAEAETYLRDSLRLKRQVGDRWGVAFSLEKLGSIEMQLGNLDEAESHFEESLAIRRTLGDRRGVALCLYRLAELARANGDEETAVSLYSDSLTRFETIGDVQAIATVRAKKDRGLSKS